MINNSLVQTLTATPPTTTTTPTPSITHTHTLTSTQLPKQGWDAVSIWTRPLLSSGRSAQSALALISIQQSCSLRVLDGDLWSVGGGSWCLSTELGRIVCFHLQQLAARCSGGSVCWWWSVWVKPQITLIPSLLSFGASDLKRVAKRSDLQIKRACLIFMIQNHEWPFCCCLLAFSCDLAVLTVHVIDDHIMWAQSSAGPRVQGWRCWSQWSLSPHLLSRYPWCSVKSATSERLNALSDTDVCASFC